MRDYLEIKFYKAHFSKNVFLYHPNPLLQKIKGIEKRNKIIDFIHYIVYVF